MLIDIITPILVFLAVQNPFSNVQPNITPLASKEMSLEKRSFDPYVNEVFKDNILLSLAYMDGRLKNKEDISWKEIRKPFSYHFILEPNKTFAFHKDVLPKFLDSVALTTNAHFDFSEGFKSDGYLFGDGVCHLASFMYWVAKEGGLVAYAPTNHSFAEIPEIPGQFGVSIYSMPENPVANAKQNLYITNNKTEPIVFEFQYDGKILKLTIGKKS